jgi:DNA-3-methyladenine glycosylase II
VRHPRSGRGRADIYLLFGPAILTLGPPAISPWQEAARLAFTLPGRPNAKETIALADPWRPWRGVAARLLWAYYRAVKQRDPAPLQSAP